MSREKLRGLRPFLLSRLLTVKVVQTLGSKLAQDLFVTAGANFSIAVLSAVGGILAARLLGPAGRGELAAAVVWAGILGTIFQVGLAQSLTYFAAKQPEEIGRIFSTSVLLALLQSLAGVSLGWMAASWLLGSSQPSSLRAVHIYLLSIPFAMMTTYLTNTAQGLGRFSLFNFLRVYQALGYVLAVTLAILLGQRTASFIVILLLCFQISACTVALIEFSRRVRPAWQPDFKLAGRLFVYGVKSYWAGLAWIANARLDQFLMSIYLLPRELGLYAVGVSYATIMFQVSGAFAMVTFPRVARSQLKSAQVTIYRMLFGNLMITLPLSATAAILSPILLPLLFGPQFGEAVPATTILLIGTVILGCNYILSDGLRGLGYPLIPSIAELAGLIVTVGGLLLVLRTLGILGAAWVSVASYSMTLLGLALALVHFSCQARSHKSTKVTNGELK